MFVGLILFGALASTCSVINAITVPVDRADVHLAPTRASMIDNGWRPLTSYESIAPNVSPSSNLERKPPASKPSNVNKVQQEYTPPTILGSFSVFGHAATKARDKPKNHPKQSTSETTRYTFLVPPPRDNFRYEIEQHRKPVTRDNDPFLRQSSFVSQSQQSPNFFSKGSPFGGSTTRAPNLSKSRPFLANGINGFAVQQSHLPPPPRYETRGHPTQFEVQKASNAKLYLQPPGITGIRDFARDKVKVSSESFVGYRDHDQPQSSPLSAGPINFYSQVDHPPRYKSTYERDPSYLVHESHEVSYVTPSSSFGFNYRPSVPFDTLVPPPGLFSSTQSSKIEPSEFLPSNSGSESFERFESMDDKPVEAVIKNAGTYYLAEEQQRPGPTPGSWSQQKSKLTTEINEVLPKKNPPAKFRPGNAFGVQPRPEIVYVRGNAPTRFENPIQEVVTVRQPTSVEPEYETPESISLKHFNEQQFLLQRQLLEEDRQRLREQELEREREAQRVREEELRKREEDLRILEAKEKEAEEKRSKQLKAQEEEEEARRRKAQEERRQRIEEQRRQEQAELREEQEARERQESIERKRKQEALEREEERKREEERAKQQRVLARLEEQKRLERERLEEEERQREPETTPAATTEPNRPEARPYRPKFPQRGGTTRRRPSTTPSYEEQRGTEPPEVTTYVVEATEIPELEAATTLPTPRVTSRPRTRRPGQHPRRRRPTTTTMPPDVTYPFDNEDKPLGIRPNPNVDYARRRPRPTQQRIAEEESSTERHHIRRRPGGHPQRVNPGEPFEAEVVTEIVKPTRVVYKETTEWQNYPESLKKKDSQEIDTDFLSTTTTTRTTTTIPEPELVTESSFEPEIVRERIVSGGNRFDIPLEHLFEEPEENRLEPVTPSEVTLTTTTTTTTTTTEAPVTTTEASFQLSSTRPTHRIRPLKYGNGTRPRFSIKDYRSRLDYRNRMNQGSTTESTLVSQSGRRRFTTTTTTERPEEVSESTRGETTGARYKYASRPTPRTTSTSNSRREENPEEPITERVNRFVPKNKKLMGNRYRSRTTTTTTTSRTPEEKVVGSVNVYSSPVRRTRPTFPRMRPQLGVVPEEATEMTAEETSFYSPIPTPRGGGDTDTNPEEVPSEGQSIAEEGDAITKEEDANDVPRNENGLAKDSDSVRITTTTTTSRAEEEEEEKRVIEDLSRDKIEEQRDAEYESTSTSPRIDDEDDFLISQRIANLTSASQLHEPGMFKAVSPATESRPINPRFAIATDEPTLPIEAFFQVLNKKEDQ